MVIFKTKRKVGELETKVKKLEQRCDDLSAINENNTKLIKEMAELIDDLKLTVENLLEGGKLQKTAQQLMTEYLFGEESK